MSIVGARLHLKARHVKPKAQNVKKKKTAGRTMQVRHLSDELNVIQSLLQSKMQTRYLARCHMEINED